MSQLAEPIRAIPDTNATRDRQREFLHRVGLAIIEERIYRCEYRPLGINFWRHQGLMRAGSEGMPKDERGFDRRINELADEKNFKPRPWLHLKREYVDIKPSLYSFKQPMLPQSCYIVNPLFAPEFEVFVLKATGFEDVFDLLDAVDAAKNQAQLITA